MGLESWGGGTKKKEKKEKEKFLLCESIGHRPLRGRCPKRKKKPDEESEQVTEG